MIYIICFLIKKFLKKPYTSFLRDFSTFYFLNPELSIVCWQCPALSIQMTFIFSNNISYLIGYYLICIWSENAENSDYLICIWSEGFFTIGTSLLSYYLVLNNDAPWPSIYYWFISIQSISRKHSLSVHALI